ncbi:MAG: hypothetical protein EOM90_11605 [Alphaproteobacteria bacterium]|nr:hypothetical protein [Alphaproteobacteria bacterium]
MTKEKPTFRAQWLALLLLLFLAVNCKKEKNDDPPPGPVVVPETILETASAVIGSQGGNVQLSDGATVKVPAGTLSADATVDFSKIGNEKIFGSPDRSAYNVSGLPKGVRVSYEFTCPAGKDPDFVGVFNYDPGSMEGTSVDFEYDQSSGLIRVEDYSTVKSLNADQDYSRWIVEWGDKQDFGDKTKLIPMPFYMQEGGSCWAAASLMLSNSYTTGYGESSLTIPHYLKAMQIGRDDGIGMWDFMKNLYYKFHSLSGGAGATTKSYWITNNLLKDIIKSLDNDRPVVLMVTPISHVVLIVGYRTYMDASGYDQHELIIHDSKAQNPVNIDEGTMYTYRKWDWFLRNKFPTSTFWAMYPDAPVHASRSLQTLGFPEFPGADQKVEFIYDQTNKRVLLHWDHEKPDGYKWVMPNAMEIDSIPASVKKLNLKLQLFNADLDNTADCELRISLFNEKKNKSTYYKKFPVTMGTDKRPVYKNFEIPVKEWLNTFGDTTLINYSLQCNLYDGWGKYLDGWQAKFRVKGAFCPLNGKWDVKYIIDDVVKSEHVWEFSIIEDSGQISIDGSPALPVTDFTINGDNFNYHFDGDLYTGTMGTGNETFRSYMVWGGVKQDFSGEKIK